MCAHPLDGAFERVTRSGEHIAELLRMVEELTTTTQHRVLESLKLENERLTVDPEKHVLPLDIHVHGFQIPPRCSILAGETMYNLRAALDYLVYELALKKMQVAQEHTQFPITTKPKGFADAIRRKHLVGIDRRHVDMIEALQPYKDRPQNAWLLDLQKLSNPDKHRTLTFMPTLLMGFVLITRSKPVDEPFRVTKDINDQDIYVKYPLQLNVSIDGRWIDEALGQLKNRVGETLEAFKPEF